VVTVSVGVGVDTTGLGLEFIEGDGGESGHFVDNYERKDRSAYDYESFERVNIPGASWIFS
jgi:hypothetical protein